MGSRLRIGILTFHRSINYGAFLQTYALQKYVEKIVDGLADVEVIDYTSKKSHDLYIDQYYNDTILNIEKLLQYIQFKRCVNVLNLSPSPQFISDDMKEIASFIKRLRYDLIIVGSDQIWKTNGMRGFPTAYWLNFPELHVKKASYAACSGNDYDRLSAEKRAYIKNALESFSYVGVRDVTTQKLVNKVMNEDTFHSYINCDPVFLYGFKFDKQKYKKHLYTKYHLINHKKLMLVMIQDERLITLLKRKFGKEYQIVSLIDRSEFADQNWVSITPFEWVKVIGCADALITNRFHGTAFALKMNIPFLSLDVWEEEERSRIKDLLMRIDMKANYYPYRGYNSDRKRTNVIEKFEEILLHANKYGCHYEDKLKQLRDMAKPFECFIKDYMKQIKEG